MPRGPGKYDPEASAALASAQAAAVVLIVIGGDRGSGFSVQSMTPDTLRNLPNLLRGIADAIDQDVSAS